ncbi:uncharacterized protein AB675_2768 [Cyphellophora attinorum]|uniref:Uncharacterized protein n=1 Tax=Cyphellophora attinorum TaxID=1664694 RepID=A0A0N0NRH2_9EURO|nr:uncharacterized protein AB675_2768 [Phialophora attinorum]KPI45081.1 hypothetical protein AB675_2768 [Phialophora attinorum]
MFSATRLQVATYLLGVCPFSIAFLVFLNSSVSFVITDLIGREDGVGDAVGSLGFADELLALVACPLWGLLSDRIGVRWVCVLGYAIIALALVLFVQAHNVYPQLLLGRLFFSIGGAAASTMVTAVLPAVASQQKLSLDCAPNIDRNHTSSPSITSELTITPARYRHNGTSAKPTASRSSAYGSTSRVAGFVGMFTGAGALIALLVFLPLPARFQHSGLSPARALQHSFYIVAVIALILAIWCFIGLRNLASEASPGSKTSKQTRPSLSQQLMTLTRNLRTSVQIGLKRPSIALGYLGGFVARASSVGISLFIPLLVNALFLDSDLCNPSSSPSLLESDPNGLPDIKRRCPRAYVVAAAMTGVAETVALIAAPIFGYASARTKRRGLPMMVAAAAGIVGYPLFVAEFDADDAQKGKRSLAFLAVCLIGMSQIGAIVCSLGVLSAGVLESQADGTTTAVAESNGHTSNGAVAAQHRHNEDDEESAPLLNNEHNHITAADSPTTAGQEDVSLTNIKGAIAGIYSFYGGFAILLLTKLGGSLFDTVSRGAPFYIMAVFNGVLFVACAVLGLRVTDDEERSRSNGSGGGGEAGIVDGT